MTDSYWRTGSPAPRRERIVWPSLVEALRQFVIVIVVGLLWGGLFFGYLRLTSPQVETPGLSQTEAAAVIITPTATPSITPLLATHTATASPIDTPTVPTLAGMPEPTMSETPAPQPSPTPTDTPEPSPTPTDTPAPAEVTDAVSFSGDVLPIFERRCVKCHGGERTEEGLILNSYADVMTGSWNGPVVEPGSAADSYLVEQIVSGDMPKREPRLLPAEIRTISDWIDAGALDN